MLLAFLTAAAPAPVVYGNSSSIEACAASVSMADFGCGASMRPLTIPPASLISGFIRSLTSMPMRTAISSVAGSHRASISLA
ncbi:hypothetical protein J8J40_30360, partial [Mycobacterium tuberculosis]|nr:hypothetical protein [Mycobacterium tuberculosis]